MSETPQYFLDSNFLIGLLDRADVWHSRACRLFDQISQEGGRLFLSDIVINETFSVFGKRCEAKKRQQDFALLAKAFQRSLSDYPILCVYEILPRNYAKIIAFMLEFHGELNFHDCLIVLFLKQVPDVTLVSFDADFKKIKNMKLLC